MQDGWMNDRYMGGWKRMDGRMNGWMIDIWMDGWMDGCG
jgi:hypothetical protein